jgi:pyruvate formate lyase activating enzyme
MPIKIDYKKCCWKNGKCSGCNCGKACVGCVEACPMGALSRKDKLILDKEKCVECGACVFACKHHAISLD